jgi:hypothetical protein
MQEREDPLSQKMTRNTIGWDVLDLYTVGYNGFPDSERGYIYSI